MPHEWRLICTLATTTDRMHTERLSKILIIDDVPADREVYKRCLRQSQVWGFEFAEAGGAASGIGMSQSWRPDCILLDFNLPDMDGIEVLAKLQGDAGRVSFPVIMLTAFGDEALAVKAMKAGAMDYQPKGQVNADNLRQIVTNAIERFNMQQRIEAQRFALEESGRRYQVLLEAIPEMVWTATAEGCVQYANNRWSEYTGLSLDNAARLGWDRTVHPDDRERSFSAWESALRSGSVLEIEHRLRRAADGSYRWHLLRAVAMRANGGESTTWFGACTDIEDQKRAERDLHQQQKEEGIGMLAGGLAHDFNNLLVGIMGGASYAMESIPADHPAQPMLRGVVQASERAAELTRKMLAYAGKGAVCVERTNFDQLVRDTCRAMRPSIPAGIRFELGGERNLPQVRTDARQLRQAVVDLVRNAVEAIGEGSGTISVRTASVEIGEGAVPENGFAIAGVAPGRYVALEVRDTGCGMDEETQKKAFDPFFSTKFTGRGLGLAAVHGFVRSNRGVVQLDSALGQGARFRMLLPAAPEKEIATGAGY